MSETVSSEHGHRSHFLDLVFYFLGVLAFVIALFIKIPFLETILYLVALGLAGYHVILEGFHSTIEDSIKNKKFLPNVDVLMTLAAFGAILIQEYREAALLILIFAGAHFLEGYAENKSKSEITKLLALNPTKARLLKKDNTIELVEVESLVKGNLVKVLNGDQIPIDGILVEGSGIVNQATITGESIPLEKNVGDHVFGGTINETGSFVLEVSKTSDETVLAKIIQLVKETQVNISKTAALIKKIEPIYVTAVLLIAPLFFLFGNRVLNWDVGTSFYRTMIFLTGASPCALAVTDIPATLASISNLARHGVLFKSGNALAIIGDMKVIAFDKTGTLTVGTPQVTDFVFTDSQFEAKKDYYHEIIASMERVSNHPLAMALLNYLEVNSDLSFEVHNELGKGLLATYNNHNYIIGKPNLIKELSENWQKEIKTFEQAGKTVVFFSEDDVVVAIIAFRDEPKMSALKALNYFNDMDVHTVLLTGDAKVTGQAIGEQLGVSQIIGDVLPQDKSNYVTALKKEYGVITMVGDGVNDAPALVAADVGLAMGNGTDIAIDVADGVLMENDLCKIAYVYQLSLKLKRIIIQNIFIALGVVVLLIVTNLLQLTSMPMVVVIHEGSTLLVILNGLRMLKDIYDKGEDVSC